MRKLVLQLVQYGKNKLHIQGLKKDIWDKAFKSGLSKFCGRQPLKYFKGYGLRQQNISLERF